MRHPKCVVALGIDVGTTNTKASLVGLPEGAPPRELATAAAPTPSDAPGLLAVVAGVVADVLAHRGVRPAAVGVASMAETGVVLDRQGAPVTEMLQWDGHRAGEQAAALARQHGAGALFAATGVRPSAKVPLATWAWLAQQGIAVGRWAGVADLVVLALTGRLVTDHTLAGRTMAYRADVGGLATALDPDLLATVGLRPEQVPAVAPPDGVAGRVAHLAGAGIGGSLRLPGVARGAPVVVAGHDHAVGTWAAGVRRPGGRADSLGTAEAVLTVLDRAPLPAPVAAAGMSWVRTASGRHHALLAGSSSAGAMLGWLAQQLAAHGSTSLSEALAAAAALDDGGTAELVVLPYLTGRQTPAPDPLARVRAVRLAGTDALTGREVADLAARSPGRLAQAVLDGVCLQARWMLEEQAALGDAAVVGPLTVLGGAARSVSAWARAKERSVPEALRWVTAQEPVATGAAVLAAARAGVLGDPAQAVLGAPALQTQDVAAAGHGVTDAVLASFVRAATVSGGRAPAASTGDDRPGEHRP